MIQPLILLDSFLLLRSPLQRGTTTVSEFIVVPTQMTPEQEVDCHFADTFVQRFVRTIPKNSGSTSTLSSTITMCLRPSKKRVAVLCVHRAALLRPKNSMAKLINPFQQNRVACACHLHHRHHHVSPSRIIIIITIIARIEQQQQQRRYGAYAP